MRRDAGRLATILIAFAGIVVAQDRPIDTDHSAIAVHVSKAGLLSAAAHDHTIDVPIASGTIRESPDPHVEFKILTAKMSVRPDRKVDPKTELKIAQDMNEMTLESGRYPEIAFHSTNATKMGDGQWKVDGDLSLHGVTKSVSLTVKESDGAYDTHTVLKQTDFGIKPISIGGGTIKVKNEVEIDFHIVPRQP
jgi:polyisoprenoid-binding protein YceI